MNKEWKLKYKELLNFFECEGHSRVPYRYKENPALGRWVQKQRLLKAKLEKKQIELLDKLGFLWSEDIRSEKNKAWLLMFRRLEKFRKEQGHCRVPSKYEPDKKLGRWVEILRLRKNELEEWKILKLESIGFSWSDEIQVKKKQHWYDMYRKLEAFHQVHGHCRVPEYWKEDPKLSIWVMMQRRPKKPLTKEKVRLLNELGFSWNKSADYKRDRDTKGRFLKTC